MCCSLHWRDSGERRTKATFWFWQQWQSTVHPPPRPSPSAARNSQVSSVCVWQVLTFFHDWLPHQSRFLYFVEQRMGVLLEKPLSLNSLKGGRGVSSSLTNVSVFLSRWHQFLLTGDFYAVVRSFCGFFFCVCCHLLLLLPASFSFLGERQQSFSLCSSSSCVWLSLTSLRSFLSFFG